MVSPKTLRALSEQGKKDREKQEEQDRKEYDRKMREQRIDKAAKDHAEAQRRITNIEYDMQVAAKQGRTSLRLGQVYVPLVSSLEGVDKIIADHFIKKGFEVDVIETPGPEIAYEPDYNHFLVVSW